ncbi:MAG TPA: hypothetical protein VGL42_01920 [Opitutaceae bacterium]
MATWLHFLGNLNLGPDEMAKLRNLLTERAAEKLDVVDVGQDQNLGTADYDAAIKQAEAETDATIAGVLGPNGPAEIGTAEDRAGSIATIMGMYGFEMAKVGYGFSSAQLDEFSSVAAGVTATGLTGTARQSALDQAMGAAARSILTPDQFNALSDLENAQRIEVEVRNRALQPPAGQPKGG